jgi:hypothetical protein
VRAPASLLAGVAAAGLPAAVTGPPLNLAQIMMVDRDGRPVPLATTMAERFAAAGRAWGRLAARTLPVTRTIVERWRPDLIVAEPSEIAGPVLAARHGIPWVRHNWGITSMPQTLPFTMEEMAGELAELGVPGLPDPDAVVKVCPPSLAGDEDPTGLPIRFVPFNGPGVLPDWALVERDRPRVLLTLRRQGRRGRRGDRRDAHADRGRGDPDHARQQLNHARQRLADPRAGRSAGWPVRGLAGPRAESLYRTRRAGFWHGVGHVLDDHRRRRDPGPRSRRRSGRVGGRRTRRGRVRRGPLRRRAADPDGYDDGRGDRRRHPARAAR